MSTRVIGIDFGTSTTSIAFFDGREVQDVKLSGTSALLDSVVAKKDGTFVFGDEAKRITTNSLKAQLTAWDRENRNDPFVYDFTDGTVDGSQAITSFLEEVLRKARLSLKDDDFGRAKGDRFYICCPASWGPRARKVLFDSANKAGVKLLSPAHIIDEPVAAGWHVLHSLPPAPERILIFDAGGGTVDVAMIEVSSIIVDGVTQNLITVVNANARPESGNVVDIAFEEHMISKGLDEKSVRLRGKEAKERLSKDASISAPFKATRADLEAAYLPILEKQLLLVGQSYQRSLQTELDLAAAATGGDPTSMAGSVARSYRFSDVETSRATMQDAPRAFSRIFLTGGMAQVHSLRETISLIFPDVPITVVDEPQLAVSRGLTQINDTLWLNGSRLPIALRAEWNVVGMERTEVASRYPKLDEWLRDQESKELIPMHIDPWQPSRSAAIGLTDSSPGVFVELPTPDQFPDERHWEFQLTFRYRGSDGKDQAIAISDTQKPVKVSHQSRRPANIKWLAHRKLVLTGSNGERLVGELQWRIGGQFFIDMKPLMAPSDPLPWPYLEAAASNVKDRQRRYAG